MAKMTGKNISGFILVNSFNTCSAFSGVLCRFTRRLELNGCILTSVLSYLSVLVQDYCHVWRLLYWRPTVLLSVWLDWLLQLRLLLAERRESLASSGTSRGKRFTFLERPPKSVVEMASIFSTVVMYSLETQMSFVKTLWGSTSKEVVRGESVLC